MSETLPSPQQIPLAALAPAPWNPRSISDERFQNLCRSLAADPEFLELRPILATMDGVIFAGNMRYRAAQQLGWPTVPAILVDIPEQLAKERALRDNGAWGEWEEDELAALLASLNAEGSTLDLLGFDERELQALLDKLGTADGLTDPDDAPPLPEEPITQPGDLWLLGDHRVLCGESTDAHDVAMVLNGEAPLLMATDPPYGIELDMEWRDRAGVNKAGKATPSYMRTRGHQNRTISGDTRADWSEAFALVPSLQVAYVWHASVHTRAVLDGLERVGFVHAQQIIWDKELAAFNRSHYWYQHEPCWYVRKPKAPWYGKSGTANSTVWTAPSPKRQRGEREEEKADHPTQKPVVLFTRPIENHLRRGELVYEPFLGSGTCLMAAEMTGRRCFGLEIEPKYVDVVVQRWEQFTGRTAERVPMANPLAEVVS